MDVSLGLSVLISFCDQILETMQDNPGETLSPGWALWGPLKRATIVTMFKLVGNQGITAAAQATCGVLDSELNAVGTKKAVQGVKAGFSC